MHAELTEDQGWIRVLDLGDVQISATTRSPVRQTGPEAVRLTVFLDGDAVLTQADRWCPAGPSGVVAQVPRSVLPLPAKELARPLDGQRGLGGVLSRWLLDLSHRAPEFSRADAPALASITVDLIAATLALPLDTANPPETPHRALRARIDRFIEERLGDPSLSPRVVADAHHLSLRRLQRLFAADHTTPAAWIRRLRLERCRHDLVTPHLRTRPVHAIARSRGFTDAAHFTRLFSAAYGVPPGEYRRSRTG
ncbi:helix-turn-helix domain-containing protein [Amycolatopsis sp. 195334CR]|uniref:helix-turn-helix domain-containing protein n=1 Tax=Amycolatopsis sp. 195334CR TaxID=2814588 RepID=UPI001A909B2A|nr:helix-turn-helix domain-containing protein [Amycolatopsis sp. 195334CR]MBN6039029.1 helix-turn-helix domain-containing protein [Amycolatopsis sp. 195334CR]